MDSPGHGEKPKLFEERELPTVACACIGERFDTDSAWVRGQTSPEAIETVGPPFPKRPSTGAMTSFAVSAQIFALGFRLRITPSNPRKGDIHDR
jgi:hypothetical protein